MVRMRRRGFGGPGFGAGNFGAGNFGGIGIDLSLTLWVKRLLIANAAVF